MKRSSTWRRLAYTVIGVLTLLLFAPTAVFGVQQGHVLVGDEAQVWMSTPNPDYAECREYQLWLSVFDGSVRPLAPGEAPTDVARALVSWQDVDVCAGEIHSDFWGEVSLAPDQFSVDVYGGAEIHVVTVPVEWQGYLQWFTFDLTWTPTSGIKADTWTPQGPGERQVFTYVDADVAGSVVNPPFPIFPTNATSHGMISRLVQVKTPTP